ncbi:UV-endonuclease UvdE-domain-containing protein, partial [Tuber borchii]
AKLEAEAEVLERPPTVNSDYMPIPWKGRLGFACLNTYLRSSNPSVFCSRTCRIDTILKRGSSGQAHIESLGLANAWDLCKLIKWNEKYGIKFLRISSGMFPLASHAKYGYSLDFAKEPLAEAGRLAMGYGHRLTTHPGQYTQLGSPRRGVVEASIRDLDYHSQLLSLLGLRGQADRDAVMVLHMGGVFEGKEETLARLRKNYIKLSDNVKARLVLENDDVAWTVHDLLPICQELNIPLVLDYHHHNIRHSNTVREGNMDLLPLFPVIKETWTRKRITQKQHYSEPLEGAITDRDRRKHAPRVSALPPCDDTMDLMIEAKDKEQAVFELYRKYNIGPKDLFNEVIPHQRSDECKPKIVKRKKGIEEVLSEEVIVPEEEVGMGGPERRVYWPQGKEEWLGPQKRIRPKKEPAIEGPEASGKTLEETATEPPKMSRR